MEEKKKEIKMAGKEKYNLSLTPEINKQIDDLIVRNKLKSREKRT